MNPVFVLLVTLAAAFIWLLVSFLYIPIGKFCHRLWSDAKEAMERDTYNKNKEEKGKKL